MVRILIALRATIARHRLARSSAAVVWISVVIGLGSAAGTLALGIAHGHGLQSACDRVAAVLALWLGGTLAQSALDGGDASLRPELLALLPVKRSRLAWALLVVGLCDPTLLIIAIAYAAVIAVAAPLGGLAVPISAIAVVQLLVLTAVAATIVGGTLGPAARRRRDLGTVTVALAISLLALAGTLLPNILGALREGKSPVLASIVRALPSGWPGDAMVAAERHEWATLAAVLLAPLVLTAVLAAAWPRLLARRMTLSHAGSSRPRPRSRLRLLMPTPTVAVITKELRLWLRDPIRFTCLLIALIVGAGTGLVPRLSSGTTILLPFAGPLTVTIAGACACNLYGNDGTSIWLTILTPRSAPADIRGRQLAWLLAVAPIATLETVLLTALAGRPALWAWALGLLIALLGGAAGVAPLASSISVQPLDEAGNPTPGWSVKIHIALLAVALSAAPTVALLTLGTAVHSPAIDWLGVCLATLTAAGCAGGLGAAATRRIAARQIDVLALLTAAD